MYPEIFALNCDKNCLIERKLDFFHRKSKKGGISHSLETEAKKESTCVY